MMINKHTHQSVPEKNRSFAGSWSPHVLLVEDDDEMRVMLADALRHEGCQVTECEDPVRWLKKCVHKASIPDTEGGDGESYDVVVSDIRMPNMSGLDVLRILQKIHCAHACPPTIFITAFGDDEIHERARELGAVTVLDKPFAVKDLIETIRQVT